MQEKKNNNEFMMYTWSLFLICHGSFALGKFVYFPKGC